MATLGSGRFTYEVSGENWGAIPEDWTYKEATAVSVDSKDNVYVFNRGGHSMIVFDSEGNILRSWGEGVFSSPHGVTIGPDDSVYCADNGDHTVRKLTTEGKLLTTLGSADRPALPMSGEPFNGPTHLAVDPRNGDLYVSDGYTNARVHKYTPDGKHLLSWGESGTDPGQFNIVHNIATDKEGWVYVADRENRRVQVFDPKGRLEAVWNNFSKAACVYIDQRGEQLAYVGEYYGGIGTNYKGTQLGPRVSIMDTQGNVLARLGEQSYGDEPGRFYSPHGIAVDSKGDIYVAEVSWSEFGKNMDPPGDLRSMQKLVKKG
jgi:hypothetical protein